MAEERFFEQMSDEEQKRRDEIIRKFFETIPKAEPVFPVPPK